MSDISINLDGLISFLAAAALGLLLVLGILIAAAYSVIRAHQKQERFTRQPSIAQVIGMMVSLLFCAIVIASLFVADRMPPPRSFAIWSDHWVWMWLLGILALWPLSAFVWKKWRGKENLQ
jgi:hypothetical protein